MGGKRQDYQYHPCRGCIHFYGSYEFSKSCNYIFDTGIRRPCPPGVNCTVKRLTRKDQNPLNKKPCGLW